VRNYGIRVGVPNLERTPLIHFVFGTYKYIDTHTRYAVKNIPFLHVPYAVRICINIYAYVYVYVYVYVCVYVYVYVYVYA